jgi:hypothetical protein
MRQGVGVVSLTKLVGEASVRCALVIGYADRPSGRQQEAGSSLKIGGPCVGNVADRTVLILLPY